MSSKSSDHPQIPEAVALVLLEKITAGKIPPDREWILNTYRECIRAVRDQD